MAVIYYFDITHISLLKYDIFFCFSILLVHYSYENGQDFHSISFHF